MITLKDARDEACKLNGNMPKLTTLGDWCYYGVITGPEKHTNKGRGGGRVGLYHSSMPIQIAVGALLMKKKYGKQTVAEIRERLWPELEDADSIRKVKKILRKRYKKLEELSSLAGSSETTGLRAKDVTEEFQKTFDDKEYLETWLFFLGKEKNCNVN